MRIYSVNLKTLQNLYSVTDNGCIYRRSDGYKFTPRKDSKGYLRLRLPYPNASSRDGRYPFKVHRLVAMFHLPNYSEHLQVNHKNGVKTDNRVENLEMVTNQENVLHAWGVLDSTERRRKCSENMKRRNNEKRNKINSLQLRLF